MRTFTAINLIANLGLAIVADIYDPSMTYRVADIVYMSLGLHLMLFSAIAAYLLLKK